MRKDFSPQSLEQGWAPGGVGFLWIPCRVPEFAGDSAVIQLHIYSFKHEINIQISLNKRLFI